MMKKAPFYAFFIALSIFLPLLAFGASIDQNFNYPHTYGGSANYLWWYGFLDPVINDGKIWQYLSLSGNSSTLINYISDPIAYCYVGNGHYSASHSIHFGDPRTSITGGAKFTQSPLYLNNMGSYNPVDYPATSTNTISSYCQSYLIGGWQNYKPFTGSTTDTHQGNVIDCSGAGVPYVSGGCAPANDTDTLDLGFNACDNGSATCNLNNLGAITFNKPTPGQNFYFENNPITFNIQLDDVPFDGHIVAKFSDQKGNTFLKTIDISNNFDWVFLENLNVGYWTLTVQIYSASNPNTILLSNNTNFTVLSYPGSATSTPVQYNLNSTTTYYASNLPQIFWGNSTTTPPTSTIVYSGLTSLGASILTPIGGWLAPFSNFFNPASSSVNATTFSGYFTSLWAYGQTINQIFPLPLFEILIFFILVNTAIFVFKGVWHLLKLIR